MSPVLGTGTGCPGRQGLGQSRVPQGWPGTLLRGPSSDPSAGGCSWGWKERASVRTFPMAPQRAHKQRELFPPAPAPGKTARFDALAPFPRPPRPLAAPERGWALPCPHPAAWRGLGGFGAPHRAAGGVPWGEILHPDPQEGPRGGCGHRRWRRRAAPPRSPQPPPLSRVTQGRPPAEPPPRVPARPVSLSHRPPPHGTLSPCATGPFAVTPPPPPRRVAAAPRGHRHPTHPPAKHRPAATRGDPGGCVLCPKVPAPHWGQSGVGVGGRTPR